MGGSVVVTRPGGWAALAAVAVAVAVGCGSRGECARAAKGTDHARTAVTCEAAFARGRDPAAGLAALRARAALENRDQAEALAGQLAGTSAEPQALLAVGELLEKTRAPRAAERLAELFARLHAGRHVREAAAVARLQGRVAWAQSRYREALAGLDAAVRLAEQAGDGALQRKALLGVFTMLYELGDLRGAAAALAEASREPRPGTAADPQTTTLIAFDRGMLADAEGNTATARAAFAEVLRSPGVAPASEIAWNASLNLLVLSIQAGDVAAASEAHTRVEALFRDGGFHKRPSSRVARGLYSAQLERLRGQPARALERLDALAASEKPSPQLKWKVALERGRALAALGQLERAIAAYEESAAVVEGLRSDQFDDFKSWVLSRQRAPFVALFELHAARGDTAAALHVLERTQGRTFLDAFAARETPAAGPGDAVVRIDWLRKLYPALRASPVLAAAPVPADRLGAQIKDVQALTYFEGQDRLHIVVVDRGVPRLVTPGPTLADVRRLVARLQESPDDERAAEEAGAALVPPGALRPGGVVHVAPTALLGRVPFAALRRAGRRLVEDHVLAQVPSLNALAVLRAAPSSSAASAAAQPTILANAENDLAEAETEAAAVAAALAGGRQPAARVHLGAAATTAALREARGAGVLHLALHSGVGKTGPWLGLHDRRLLAAEILDWRLSAGLVVLASCASAATPDPGLWGSLAASFLAAGSAGVVASLWSTEDRVSREFVERFYAERGVADPAAAVARAQRAWIAAKRPVRDWAAFAFYGSGNIQRRGRSTAHAEL